MGTRPARAGWSIWIGASAVVAAVVWLWRPAANEQPVETEPTPTQPTASGRPAAAASTAVDRADPITPSPTAEAPGVAPETPLGATPRPETPGADPVPSRPRWPRLGNAVDRQSVPSGTPRAQAEAYRALPRGRGDREPVGGIGAEGLHVDNLAIGSRVASGMCEGERSGFRVGRHDTVHLCIRLVHRRIAQQILVRWEREGRLVRRQWLPVPSAHAYRTRASLPVKKGFDGRWTVRVLSLDGIELATHTFQIDAASRTRGKR